MRLATAVEKLEEAQRDVALIRQERQKLEEQLDEKINEYICQQNSKKYARYVFYCDNQTFYFIVRIMQNSRKFFFSLIYSYILNQLLKLYQTVYK